MNRRKFFKSIGVLTSAAVITPDILKNVGSAISNISTKQKCIWTCEMENDLQSFYGLNTIDIIMSKQIQREIDEELIHRLTT